MKNMMIIEVFEDAFLQNVAGTAGCSNTLTVSKEDRRTVREALEKIEKLVSSVEEADEEHSSLISLAEKLQVAIAPHKTLPDEVLRAIFLALLPLSEVVPHRRDVEAMREEVEEGTQRSFEWLDIMSWDFYEPRRIRGVCFSWRQIALEQRDLWCNIQIRWPSLPVDIKAQSLPLETLVDMAARIIPSAGPVNLRLFLLCPPRNIPLGDAVPYTFTRLVFDLADRLESLAFTGDVSGLDIPFYLPDSITFPRLRTVQIVAASSRLRNVRVPGHHGPTRAIFHCSPNLQEIDVRLGVFEDVVFSKPVPWTKITHLSLQSPMSLETLLPALKNASNMRSLTLAVALKTPTVGGSTQDEVILPHLEQLCLQIYPGSETFFDLLRVPALSKLNISGSSPSCMDKLAAMMDRSGCSVTSFRDSTPPNANDPSSIARASTASHRLAAAMPKLRQLRTEAIIERPFLRSLGSGRLLPHLETFSCKSALSVKDFAETLEAGLKSRDPSAPPNTHLRRVTMNATSADDSDEESDREATMECMDRLEEIYGVYLNSFSPVNIGALFGIPRN